MAANRIDPHVPNITIEKEDRDAYQRQRKTAKATTTVQPSSTVTAQSGFPWFTFFTFLLVLGSSAGGYWFYQQYEQTVKQLQASQQRIEDLENRLSATDQEMGQSTVTLQVKVTELAERTDELWSQMDKLWASAWRKNQSEIKELDKKVSGQGSQHSKKLTALESDIALYNTNLAVFQEKLSAAESQLSKLTQIEKSLLNASQLNNTQTGKINSLEEKVITAEQRTFSVAQGLGQLETNLNELQRQLDDLKKAKPIEVFNPPPAVNSN